MEGRLLVSRQTCSSARMPRGSPRRTSDLARRLSRQVAAGSLSLRESLRLPLLLFSLSDSRPTDGAERLETLFLEESRGNSKAVSLTIKGGKHETRICCNVHF